MRIFASSVVFMAITASCAVLTAGESDDDKGPPRVYPVSEIIDLGPPEKKDPVLEALERIQEQNAQLRERIDRLEEHLDERTEPPHKRLFETGVDIAFRQGDALLVIETNIAFVNAYLMLPRGWGVGLGPTIEAWRFRIRPIAAGLLWYFDKHHPLTVRAIPRDWDLLFSTGTDFLVWRGLQVRFQVFWSLPNPGDVTSYAARRAAGHWDDLRDQVDKNVNEAHRATSAEDVDRSWERTKTDVTDFAKNVRSDGDIFNKAYKRAGKLPYFVIGLRWEF